jgi:hypothetical protein
MLKHVRSKPLNLMPQSFQTPTLLGASGSTERSNEGNGGKPSMDPNKRTGNENKKAKAQRPPKAKTPDQEAKAAPWWHIMLSYYLKGSRLPGSTLLLEAMQSASALILEAKSCLAKRKKLYIYNETSINNINNITCLCLFSCPSLFPIWLELVTKVGVQSWRKTTCLLLRIPTVPVHPANWPLAAHLRPECMRTAAVGDMQHHLTKMESTRASLEASHMT